MVGIDYSATGKNPGVTGFTEKSLNAHFGSGGKSDHAKQYPGITKEQYAQRALELARSPVGNGIEGYKVTHGRYKGSIVRFDTSTNDWVRAIPDGSIVTMFKPTDKSGYFEAINQIETREH
jgi:pyocin large subunit-like protein